MSTEGAIYLTMKTVKEIESKIDRLLSAVAYIATEIEVREDEAVYPGAIGQRSFRSSLEQAIEQILYPEHFPPKPTKED